MTVPTGSIFGDLSGRVEPDIGVRVRQKLGGNLGPEEPYRSEFSMDAKLLTICWESAGNGSMYSVEIHQAMPGDARHERVAIGTGDAMQTGVPGLKGPLHLGLISKPQAIRNNNGVNDMICSTSGFYGGMFLCRRVPDSDGFLFREPRRVFLPQLNHDTVDWNDDGRMDLVCPEGEQILLWKNIGTNSDPIFRRKGHLQTHSGNLRVKNLSKVEVVDWDGDGLKDLVVGTSDRSEYRRGRVDPWRNRKFPIGFGKGYTPTGQWQGGREHSSIMLCRNTGTCENPVFDEPVWLSAGGSRVDLNGGGKLSTGDLNGDGDLDIVFGDHLDKITYFENVGSKGSPRLRKGRPLRRVDGGILRNPQCMTEPVICDLDEDGFADLVFGSEDGYIYFCRNSGPANEPPTFNPPIRVKQRNPMLGTGGLAVPSAVDWDGDGDLDLIVGCSAGYVEYYENIGSRRKPRFGPCVRLKAGGETIRIQAGHRGSIQGPKEAKWGYTCPVVCDWDGDGLKDIILSDIKGRHLFYRNVGEPGRPILDRARPIRVEGKELRTVWRTRPISQDLNGDGLADYVCLDRNGYLTIHWRRRRAGRLILDRGIRPRYVDGSPIKMDGTEEKEGRTQLCAADWDGDGDWDIVFGAFENTPLLGGLPHTTVLFMENVGSSEEPVFERPEPILIQGSKPMNLGLHCCSPHAVDWDGDGELDLIVGAENGNIYYFHRSYLEDRGEARILR